MMMLLLYYSIIQTIPQRFKRVANRSNNYVDSTKAASIFL